MSRAHKSMQIPPANRVPRRVANEQRFRTPELLVEHGIRRAMNVILQGDGSPFGVLEVDSTSEGEFGEHDIVFAGRRKYPGNGDRATAISTQVLSRT